MGASSVRRCVKHFKDRDITDQLCCGQQRTAANEWNKQKVNGFITQDRSITVRETATQLGVGHHAVQEVMEILEYWKVCSPWVPHFLTEEYKMAGNYFPIQPIVWIWPPQITTCSDP
jgi:hypothetical protein